MGSQLVNIDLKWNNLETITNAILHTLAGIALNKSASGEAADYDAQIEGQMKLDVGHYEDDFQPLQFQEITPSSMSGYKEAITSIFNKVLRIFYIDKEYMRIEDPEVLRVLMEVGHYGDGTGITRAETRTIYDFGSIFKGNTLIQKFDEISEFNIRTLAARAFEGCTSLIFDDLKLPYVTSIAAAAFQVNGTVGARIRKASNLGSITYISGYNGNGVFFNQKLLTSVVLPNTVKEIQQYAFYDCSALTSINLESVESIDNRTFTGCTSLIIDDLNMPNLNYLREAAFQLNGTVGARIRKVSNLGSITYISGDNSNGVFYNQKLLTSVVLSNLLTAINGVAFSGCTALQTLIIYATTPPSLGSNSFASVPFMNGIFVPDESVSAYKAASGWSAFASKIFPISELPEE